MEQRNLEGNEPVSQENRLDDAGHIALAGQTRQIARHGPPRSGPHHREHKDHVDVHAEIRPQLKYSK
jgi:hypothetical protein